jgi:hypothetical protein
MGLRKIISPRWLGSLQLRLVRAVRGLGGVLDSEISS